MSLLGDTYQAKEKRSWNAAPLEARKPMLMQPMTDQVPQGISPQPQQSQSIYEMVRDYGKPRDYAQEIRNAERAKKMATLTDILGMAGNLGTGLAGRRIFGQQPSATVAADARLQKLKDLQQAGQIDYSNRMMQAKIQDAANDRAARNQAYKQALDKAKLDADMAYKKGRLRSGDLDREARAKTAMMEEQGRNDRANKDRMVRATLGSERNQISRAKAASKLNNDYDFLMGNDWTTKIPKAEAPATFGYLYNKMVEIAAAHPEKYTAIPDVKLQIGEGGDSYTKMRSIVLNRIKDFPELQEEINLRYPQYNQGAPIRKERPNYWQQKYNKPLPYEGPLRPQEKASENKGKKQLTVTGFNPK